MGVDSKRMFKKFEKLVETQERVDSSHVKAAEREGLTLVNHKDGSVAPENLLFNASTTRSTITANTTLAETNASLAQDALGNWQSNKKDFLRSKARLEKSETALKDFTASPPAGLSPELVKSRTEALQSKVTDAREEMENNQQFMQDGRKELDEAVATARTSVDELKQSKEALLDAWV
jgi:transcription initiation factor IIF auxiliary subunit